MSRPLKEHLAASKEKGSATPMERVVYVLGAGFSAPLGLPVVRNFLEKSKQQYFANPERYDKFKGVLNKIDAMQKTKSYYNADLFDIEEILSMLEMQSQLEANGFRDEFIDYLCQVIRYHTPSFEVSEENPQTWQNWITGSGDIARYVDFVASLHHLVINAGPWAQGYGLRDWLSCDREPEIKSHYSIITLNYDLVPESGCAFINQRLAGDLGFSRSLEEVRENPNRPTLAKLHGSIDGPIIPPTWNKTLADNVGAWRLALEMLKQANHIRFIGYSLPLADSYVRYLLKAAILETAHLKAIDVLCLDPDNQVKGRFKDFVCFPRFRFEPRNVRDYLDAVSNCREGTANSLHFSGIERAHMNWFPRE